MFTVEPGLFDFALFGDFVDHFFEVFFAVAVFLFVPLVFFVARLLVFAGFFSVDTLADARRDLRAGFTPRFLTVFFLAVATTISFYCSNKDFWG
ncbi:MAG: hypothetical protein WA615_17960 [Bradyrhizobium sp.]|uniref:hypothetical protein n=1 Tax=Bradyrhizobium sp. TaxID=376 RepID=UPI003C7A6662